MFNLVNILMNFSSSWLLPPFAFLFLLLDGLVYTLVGLSYNLFQLMTQLNFSTLENWLSPVTNNIRAVIAVVILFIIGYALIEYLINPDKAKDKSKAGGVAVIKNIAIASILLVASEFIFNVLNEVTFLLVGTPSTYHYTVLNTAFGITGGKQEDGLIARVIFGGNNAEEEDEVDFGRRLALNTLSIFLHGDETQGLYDANEGYDKSVVGQVFKESLEQDNFNIILSLPTGVYSEVGRSVFYFPVLGTAIGAYIVYSIVMLSIELGKRALKLVILQIMAPIPIITIMKDGFNSKIWKSYISTYIKTYTDAFIRIFAMYFGFALISVAFNRVPELFDNNVKLAENPFTASLLVIIIIVSALTLSKELPKLIDGIFGSKLAENNKVGLGNFLGAAAGAIGGSAIGGLAGATTRFRNSRAAGLGVGRSLLNGAMGGVSGATTGTFGGLAAGAKFKGDKIGESFRNIGSESIRTGSVGIGGYLQNFAEQAGFGRESRVKQELTLVDDMEKRRQLLLNNAGKQIGSKHAFDYSKDKSTAVSEALKNDTRYQEIERQLEIANKSSDGKLRRADGTIETYADGTEKTAESLYEDMKNRKDEFNADYDYGVGRILANDTTYTRMAHNARKFARQMGTTGDSLETGLVRNSAKTLKDIKNSAALTENENARINRGIQKPKGGNK